MFTESLDKLIEKYGFGKSEFNFKKGVYFLIDKQLMLTALSEDKYYVALDHETVADLMRLFADSVTGQIEDYINLSDDIKKLHKLLKNVSEMKANWEEEK